ncbi:TIGR03790 family protein [Leptodesmis sp.]|uniref:TIGR03790 family protein n=1 Tax=Leptodesmis sp. TaxID=3100501 RepID=UPI0040534C8D
MRDRPFIKLFSLLMGLLTLSGCGAIKTAVFPTPSPSGVSAQNLAIIANQADPLSMQIARYYQQRREIPEQNLIVVSFQAGRTTLPEGEFRRIKTEVEAKIPAQIQAFALTWVAPYRVDCMSITSAFAFGFDDRFCAKGCLPTQASPYFNQKQVKPFDRFRIRPTMTIAATTFAQAKALIDRGVAADGTYPDGTAYLLSTSDRSRNVRARLYPLISQYFDPPFKVVILNSDVLEQQTDIMFYFTGLTQVQRLETNRFRPGAIADHLTSVGGALTDSFQMSSLRWLEAGATGSYGTVVEPCNFPAKFPNPAIAMFHYFQGDTLLEAYWKSVAQPGQGIFIGEPLARPFPIAP